MEPIKTLKNCSTAKDLEDLLKYVNINSIKIGLLGDKRVKIGNEQVKESDIVKKFQSICENEEDNDSDLLKIIYEKILWLNEKSTKKLEKRKKTNNLTRIFNNLFKRLSKIKYDKYEILDQLKNKYDLDRQNINKIQSSLVDTSFSTSSDVFSSVDSFESDSYYTSRDSLTSSSSFFDVSGFESDVLTSPFDSDETLSGSTDEEDEVIGFLTDTVIDKNSEYIPSAINTSYETVEALLTQSDDVIDFILNNKDFYKSFDIDKKDDEAVKLRNNDLYEAIIKEKKLEKPINEINETALIWLCMLYETSKYFPQYEKKINNIYQLIKNKIV